MRLCLAYKYDMKIATNYADYSLGNLRNSWLFHSWGRIVAEVFFRIMNEVDAITFSFPELLIHAA